MQTELIAARGRDRRDRPRAAADATRRQQEPREVGRWRARAPRRRRSRRAQARRPHSRARSRPGRGSRERSGEASARRKRPRKSPADAEAAAAYKAGLAKTRGGFVASIGKLFGKKKIDATTVDELEEVLFTADIGPRAADRIFQSVKKGLSKDDLEDADKIWSQIRRTSREILAVDAKPLDLSAKKPFVLLVLGVNGVGKTTTIGKLATKWKDEGKKVLLAAGDTFRAAATEQLEEWAQARRRRHREGQAERRSVARDLRRDQAGRRREATTSSSAIPPAACTRTPASWTSSRSSAACRDKAMPGAPHETWMVLDATTGQNAISQAKTFKADMEITGIVLTKLDGSSKGGVVLGICDELKVPVRFVGVGEKIGRSAAVRPGRLRRRPVHGRAQRSLTDTRAF